jgi:DNA end-binding protein Ku
MVALGRLVMSTRERICAIEVENDALLLTTLRAAEEVRTIDHVGPAELPKADPRMLDIARKIIEQQASNFDPSEFKDRYEDALRALIEEKRKGLPVRPAAAPEKDTNVVNLMDALRKSLQSGAQSAAPATSRAAASQAGTRRPTSAKPRHAGSTTRTSTRGRA